MKHYLVGAVRFTSSFLCLISILMVQSDKKAKLPIGKKMLMSKKNKNHRLSHFLVVLQESEQIDLNNEFNSIFAEFEKSDQISFDVNYVQLDRKSLDEHFGNCNFRII